MALSIDEGGAPVVRAFLERNRIAQLHPSSTESRRAEGRLARKIIKDQTKAIAQFDAWMKKHP